MKRISILLASIIIVCNTTIAQNESQKKETFDNNTFRWEEITEKKKSAIIQDGYLVLQNKKKNDAIKITTRFPMQVKRNFKVTSNFLIPKLNDDNRFGIVFNRADDDNFSLFLVKEGHYYFINSDNGRLRVEKEGKIKLKDGKNQDVSIALENKGGKLFFSVNNMTAYEVRRELRYLDFGFYMEGATTIMVDEVVIEQNFDEYEEY